MRSPHTLTVASTCAAVVPRSQSYTLSKTTSKRRPISASRIEAASLRSATRFSTRRPKSCFGLRCSTVTSWPSFSSSSTSNFPMKRVPPITNTLIGFSALLVHNTTARAVPDTHVIQKIQRLIVIFQTQMGDQILAPHPAQRILQFHELDKDVVLGINLRGVHGRLEVKRQPFLHPAHAGPLRQVHQQHDIQHQRRR